MAANDEPPKRRDDDLHSGVLRKDAAIGRYRVIGVVGQGGFGITYLARDTQLGREVAIKEYLPELFALRGEDGVVLPRSSRVAADFSWGRDRFIEEARTLAQFGGTPGVVEVYDFLEANGTAYMVMAFVRGETLDKRLKREGRLDQPTIERILSSLLDGLERVHDVEVLHRDIKPSNVMVDASGRATLIDFGASRLALQGRTQTLTAIYTPGYAAFEQMTAAKQGPWTDIYALSATLYHCVTGAPPPQAADRMIEDDLVPATRLASGRYAPQLLRAIDAALAVKASDRPQTIAAWRSLLSPAVASATISAAPTIQPTMKINPPSAIASAEIPTVALSVAPPMPSKRVPPVRTIIVAAALAIFVIAGGSWFYASFLGGVVTASGPISAGPAPSATAQVMDELLSVDRLGLMLATLTPERRIRYGIPADVFGLVVVQTDSSASADGVRTGDVMVGIEQSRISSIDDIKSVTGSLPVGRVVAARLVREAESVNVRLWLR